MKLLQLNTTVNSGSTGRIAEDIGQVMLANDHESYIAYGRGDRPSKSKLIKIGRKSDVYLHGLKTLLLDRHGFGSHKPTAQLIKEIERIQPDAIGLHNLHGYYLHIGVLFKYLKESGIPVLWTLFDCWAFTGHCTYYDSVGCEKWKSECHHCPKTKKYPASYGLDQSRRNFRDKNRLFHLPSNLHLVVHSKWLAAQVKQSFLKDLPLHHIYNGTDIKVFVPRDSSKEKLVLGVASTWDERKGLKDFIRLREMLPDNYQIVLIGLRQKQIQQLPKGVKGIERTENVNELAEWYSRAEVFVNPTYQDNFPTTNIEALACGTPVVTYNTGGSPEAVDSQTGRVVEKGNLHALALAVESFAQLETSTVSKLCRQRAELLFDQENRYQEYVQLYESLASNSLD